MCKFCDRFWDRFWVKSDAWERAHSNESDLWAEETVQNRGLIDQALAIQDTERATTFQLYLEAADAGSIWSMEKVGWHYQTGTFVAKDLAKAQDYYYRAVCAGSWMATLEYARLLAEQGHHEYCERVLENGVASDFVPAYVALARFRYEQSKTAMVCREVRPLLDYAARRGHPEANVMLARWMMSGKLGIHKIPQGYKLALQSAFRSAYGADADADLRGAGETAAHA